MGATRIGMTLVARDSAETLESQLLFHLNAGVEAIVVGDDGASDESRTTIERFEQDGRVRTVRDPSELERTVIAELGMDWVIEAAAGEFWWPRGGGLADILSKIPPNFDVVQAIARPFLRVEGAEELVERTIYRLSAQAMLDEPGGSPRPSRRLAHRAGVDVGGFDGGLVRTSLRPLRGWYPIEVLCLPVGPADRAEYVSASDIEAGLATDVVQLDTRVRDALRTLRDGGELMFTRPSVVENAWFAVDAAVLGEADAFRLRTELDEVERRLAEVEENPGVRLERKLRKLVRRSRDAG